MRTVLSRVASFSELDALRAAEVAALAWDQGQGYWPQLPLGARVTALRRLAEGLAPVRQQLASMLVREICKSSADAAAEVDGAIEVIASTAEAVEAADGSEDFSAWSTIAGVRGRALRRPVGVVMLTAPAEAPLLDVYSMMIPALAMGNTIVLKLPTSGGLTHMLTVKALEQALPPGVVNFVSGSCVRTLEPIMRSGLVDCLGFMGDSEVLSKLIIKHPQPHRLRVFSQLAGKNVAVVLPDADLQVAASVLAKGSLTFNGQCRDAFKLVLAHDSIAEALVENLAAQVSSLKCGMPWEEDVTITPLVERSRSGRLEGLITDAVENGASVANAASGGGSRAGALFVPIVVFPVAAGARLFREDQSGPVIPVATFSDTLELSAALKSHSWSAPQAAIFSSSGTKVAPLIDMLSTAVKHVSINGHCCHGRGRDERFVTEALSAFSTQTVVAFPDGIKNRLVMESMEEEAKCFQPAKRQRLG